MKVSFTNGKRDLYKLRIKRVEGGWELIKNENEIPKHFKQRKIKANFLVLLSYNLNWTLVTTLLQLSSKVESSILI